MVGVFEDKVVLAARTESRLGAVADDVKQLGLRTLQNYFGYLGCLDVNCGDFHH
jgi:hypothetical protein